MNPIEYRIIKRFGLLSSILWKFTTSDQLNMIRKGFELLSNRFQLRNLSKEEWDLIIFRHFPKPGFIYNADNYVVLELKGISDSTFSEDKLLIEKTLLAFRLLKYGDVFLDSIYTFYEDQDSNISIARNISQLVPRHHARYELNIDEIPNLLYNFKAILSIDFEKNPSIRITCDRFGRSYHDIHPEDKLIDLMIGFEALFLKGSRRGNKGHRIGKKCSELIEENKTKQKKIYKCIKKSYLIRNDILHSLHFDRNEIRQLLPSIEDYLRKSILRLIS